MGWIGNACGVCPYDGLADAAFGCGPDAGYGCCGPEGRRAPGPPGGTAPAAGPITNGTPDCGVCPTPDGGGSVPLRGGGPFAFDLQFGRECGAGGFQVGGSLRLRRGRGMGLLQLGADLLELAG